jgi:hypothetical protein
MIVLEVHSRKKYRYRSGSVIPYVTMGFGRLSFLPLFSAINLQGSR